MAESVRDVIILGSGPAGYTAAIYAGRANLKPLVATGLQPGGQLTTTTDVENFPGFEKGIMGPELMEVMRLQAERFGAEMKYVRATEVNLEQRPFEVKFEDDSVAHCKALIVSTGATAKTLNLAREWDLMGYGLSTCATCDGAFFKDQEIVVIGGGDSACEEANYLTRFGKRVRLVHRRDQLRASKIMAQRVLDNPKIEVLWNQQPIELLGEKAGGITGLKLKHTVSGEESTIDCAAIFYAIGHTPNTDMFKGKLDMDENGYLITQPGTAHTNITGVFACGDAQDHVYRQAITAAGTGCMAAIDAERFLAHGE